MDEAGTNGTACATALVCSLSQAPFLPLGEQDALYCDTGLTLTCLAAELQV